MNLINTFNKIIRFAGENIKIRNVNDTRKNKNCLFVFTTKPFVLKKISNHTNFYEGWAWCKLLNKYGYNVDVIHYNRKLPINYKKYDLIVGMGDAFTKASNNKGVNCKSIYYATGALFTIANFNELNQWLRYFKKHNFANISNDRIEKTSNPVETLKAIINSDAVVGVSDDWAKETYKDICDRYYHVGAIAFRQFYYEKFCRKYEIARDNYLCIVGNGYIHKGVHILIEAFSQLQKKQLFVVGPIEQEVLSTYGFDAQKYSNIKFVGYLDTKSERFSEICNNCCFIISTSCSEGCCTSVLTGMATGLIPIISKESSVSIKNTGFYLCENTYQGVIDIINNNDHLTISELDDFGSRARKLTMSMYSVEKYEERLDKSLESIIFNF